MKEPQYEALVEHDRRFGRATLGLMSNQRWGEDPRGLVFTLARYKFAAKMVAGAGSLLEVGCGDCFGTRLLRQVVSKVTAVDFDPAFIQDAAARNDPRWGLDLRVCDMLEFPVSPFNFQAAVALDVLEHVAPADEGAFLGNIVKSLDERATAVIGMPSLESQHLGSAQSRAGHVNCKSGPDLVATLRWHFDYVLPFSMSDEVVHTGHHAMAHYLLCVCCGPRRV